MNRKQRRKVNSIVRRKAKPSVYMSRGADFRNGLFPVSDIVLNTGGANTLVNSTMHVPEGMELSTITIDEEPK